MLRRSFLGTIGLLGAGRLASLIAFEDGRPGRQRTVDFHVKGFTCPTCAVGLETLLRREKGVLTANVDYASATANIGYDAALLDDEKLKSFIQSAGFLATKASG